MAWIIYNEQISKKIKLKSFICISLVSSHAKTERTLQDKQLKVEGV